MRKWYNPKPTTQRPEPKPKDSTVCYPQEVVETVLKIYGFLVNNFGQEYNVEIWPYFFSGKYGVEVTEYGNIDYILISSVLNALGYDVDITFLDDDDDVAAMHSSNADKE